MNNGYIPGGQPGSFWPSGQPYGGQQYDGQQYGGPEYQGAGYDEVAGWYNDPALQYAGVAAWRKRRRRRRLTWLLVIGVLLGAGYFGYTKVYLPWHNAPAAAAASTTVPTPVLGTDGPSPLASSVAPSLASPPAISSGKPAPPAPPTLAWQPWLESRGGKDRVNMELGDTALVTARQNAQTALRTGKIVRIAGAVLAKRAADELSVARDAQTAPLPPTVAQAAWKRAIAEVIKGASQLQAAGKAMQAGQKVPASRAIAASNPTMQAAFNDLTAVDLSIPAP